MNCLGLPRSTTAALFLVARVVMSTPVAETAVTVSLQTALVPLAWWETTISVWPGERAVTMPVELTVATAGFPLDHWRRVLAPLPVRVAFILWVWPTPRDRTVGSMVRPVGSATVTEQTAEILLLPLRVAVTMAVPAVLPAVMVQRLPLGVMAAMAALLVLQMMVPAVPRGSGWR